MHLMPPLTICNSVFPRWPEKIDVRTSSASRGRSKAPENGQPTMAPVPNHIMPSAILFLPLRSRNAVNPSIDVYIVNVDGKNAVDAWKKPGLKIVMIKKSSPILLLSVLDIAE